MVKEKIGSAIESGTEITQTVRDFFSIGDVTTVDFNDSASVTTTDGTLSFEIPHGKKGDTGPKGDEGPRGFNGDDGNDGSDGPRGFPGDDGPDDINSNTEVTGSLFMSGNKITGVETLSLFDDQPQIIFTENTTDNAFRIAFQNGNPSFFTTGVTNPTMKLNDGIELQVQNKLTANEKQFLIDHPTKDEYELRHGSYEGPVSGGLIYRDVVTVTDKTAEPDFPEYVLKDNFGTDWVTTVTAHDHFGNGYVDTDTWTVHTDSDGMYDVMIFGKRDDEPVLRDSETMMESKESESWEEAYDRFKNGATDIEPEEYAN